MGLTYLRVILERNVDFFWQTDWGSGGIRQNKGLVLFSVDLKKVSADFADLCKKNRENNLKLLNSLYMLRETQLNVIKSKVFSHILWSYFSFTKDY